MKDIPASILSAFFLQKPNKQLSSSFLDVYHNPQQVHCKFIFIICPKYHMLNHTLIFE